MMRAPLLSLFVFLGCTVACDGAEDEPLGTGGATSQGGASAGGMGGTGGTGGLGDGGNGGAATGTPSGAPTGTPTGQPDTLPCTPVTTWDPAWEALENELIDLINARRLAGGTCGSQTVAPTNAVLVDPAWRNVARAHADDMATLDYLDWTAPGGQSWLQQPQACGLLAETMGTNMTAGQATAQQVFDAVIAGEGTCMNLHVEADVIGVGYTESAMAQIPTRWTMYLGTGN